ncbi:MAG: DUF72 domain-containing protein [Gemmatimonadota bacterium]
MTGSIFVGISGWTYAGWRGPFYPDDVPHSRELEFASRQFNAIEINGTFYSLQRPHNFADWRDRTPDDFCFAVKGSQFITHMKQLRDAERPLANFFASGVLRLEEKLGPILWQFSDRMRYDRERFERFLELLPKSERSASRLARRHDARVTGRSSFHTSSDRRIRHAFEVRNPTFFNDDFLGLLRAHEAALVFSDAAADWPYAEDVTADFVYLRLHGAEELYASGYTTPALGDWADRVRAWSAGREPANAHRVGAPAPATQRGHDGRDAFVFFDNDAKVHAPFDAFELADRLDIDWRFHHAE